MPRKTKYQTISGVHDILPEEQPYYHKIRATAERFADFYGYGRIDTPVFEREELFTRGVGQSTDVVQKQMYTFTTKGDDELALRPEATAGIARAYLEHGMQSRPQPVKLWTMGPFYRYERPQAGRYRQFHQVNFEALGDKSPAIDAQLILIFKRLLEALNITNIEVEINSLGDSNCRPQYKEELVAYLKEHRNALCEDCTRRVKDNPLRVLDCKEEKCQRVANQAPQLVDHLCKECKQHFTDVLEFLDEMDIPYNLNPYLVRGLDYYTKTVFEVFSKEDTGTDERNALGGGGRYDALLSTISNKDVPGCGFAVGIERAIEEAKTHGKKVLPEERPPEVFLVQLGKLAKQRSLNLLEEFRKAQIPVAASLGKDSLRPQLREADKMGVKYTLIYGQKEAMEGEIAVRDMESGDQEEVALDKVVQHIKKQLKNKK